MDEVRDDARRRRAAGMSYKFQRLRERIRQSVASGELSGKLPGERELARRFHVNAKTLSKALTDLAAEGLLHRSIGRGTFVKGQEPAETGAAGPWLILADPATDSGLVEDLKAYNSQVDVVDNTASLRPSFLNQFAAVIDLAQDTPETFIRNLLVRNVAFVSVGRLPRTYSTNAVLLDSALGATMLARNLILAGHRRFIAVEPRNQTSVAESIRNAASRFGNSVSIDSGFPQDVVCSIDYGVTACICDSVENTQQTLSSLTAANISVPAQISVTGIGWTGNQPPCTGYYISLKQKAAAIVDILQSDQSGKPSVLWLNGALVDMQTTAPVAQAAELQPAEAVHSFPMLSLATHAAVG
jgi:hypothetical protein